MTQQETIIREATFNPKVKTYIFVVVLFYLITSIVGIVLVPFWLFGLGQWLSTKFFHTLTCRLSDKNLRFSRGIIIHVEKTIPLENIQDLSFIGGPILRWFGLTIIKVETAGGGGPRHNNMMSMIGINDAEAFKSAILEQREEVIRTKNQQQMKPSDMHTTELLGDIKDLLQSIATELQHHKK
jgi:putative membrane protein